ncbi:hypothetical protein [Microvirga sp. VF16]|uniref:hypothetical protein n=1 Tax=Microvirga sp. VF16 TaxID=2807101 RepID=UPI00193D0823|nr:hypothetical protein [Microvirga sp. VF16]QRM32782.1 hypothetical protein JO965_25750 [Microvirga sp. VF16]
MPSLRRGPLNSSRIPIRRQAILLVRELAQLWQYLLQFLQERFDRSTVRVTFGRQLAKRGGQLVAAANGLGPQFLKLHSVL